MQLEVKIRVHSTSLLDLVHVYFVYSSLNPFLNLLKTCPPLRICSIFHEALCSPFREERIELSSFLLCSVPHWHLPQCDCLCMGVCLPMGLRFIRLQTLLGTLMNVLAQPLCIHQYMFWLSSTLRCCQVTVGEWKIVASVARLEPSYWLKMEI